MKAHFFVISWNHHQTPIVFRDGLSLRRSEIKKFIQATLENKSIVEIAILSTCNRTEFITIAENVGDVLLVIKNTYENSMGRKINWEKHGPELYSGIDAFKHLCQVAAGLESMAFGEEQISLQVKLSHKMLMESQPYSTILDKLFFDAMNCSTQIRHEFNIHAKSSSVSELALKKVKDYFSDLRVCSALIIGAGETATLTAKLFKKHGIQDILISNRNERNGKILSEHVSGRFVQLDELNKILFQCNVVIAATYSDQYLLNKNQIAHVMDQRKGKLLFFDMGSPRNLDPTIMEIENVHLHDLDSLNPRVLDKTEDIQGILDKAKEIMEKHGSKLMDEVGFAGNPKMSEMEFKEVIF